MQIIDNKALLLTTSKHAQITALIPKSRVIATRGNLAQVLVHWGDTEAKLLRNLKIKGVPHPILKDYNWPGIIRPFDHQRETAAFFATHPRCLCLSEQGTGKTASAAWAADYLMRRGDVKRVLVVCPVSIMETAWRSDLFKTIMHRSVAIATGGRLKREEVVNGPYEFVIINYDGVKVIPEVLRNGGFDLIIVDEATNIKNVQTQRWKALASMIGTTTRVWLMTGTPSPQSPEDAYGLAKIVNPAGVPRFAGAWRDMVMIKLDMYRWIPRANAQDLVHNALQPAIRFTKAECLDLPDMLYTTRHVPLTKQQQHYYDEIRKEMVAEAAGSEIVAVNAASKLNKLLQISCGVAYTTERDVVEFDIKDRFNELMDVINGTAHKVIVFVPFRHALDTLQENLRRAHITVEAIHGGVTGANRGAVVKQFQSEDDPKVLLIIPQAGSHGLTLTRADTVVWWGPTTSAELYLQGNARAHRAGQTNKVTIVRLEGSPVERRLYKMLDQKIDMHNILVDMYKEELNDA